MTAHFTLVYFAPSFDQNGRSAGSSTSTVEGLETLTTLPQKQEHNYRELPTTQKQTR